MANQVLVPEARDLLERLKIETAHELGLTNYTGYRGQLTSRQNGLVGGYMVKKLIALSEMMMEGEVPDLSNLK